MNSQSESKADGPQQTPSHTMKIFFDSRSDYLLELRQIKNSTRIRIKSLKETDSRNNPLRIGRWNPTRSRFLLSLQKENYSVRLGAAGLLTGGEYSRVGSTSWVHPISTVTTRIAVGLVGVQGNFPTHSELDSERTRLGLSM